MEGITTYVTDRERSVSIFSYGRVVLALLGRDLAVLKKTAIFFVVRVVMQPLLFVFIFTYVFPKIGQGVGGAGGKEAEFSTLLVAGVVGISIIFQAIQAVALPLVQEFGYTKEIEDRALAPIPTWGLAVEKILSGAIQAIFCWSSRIPDSTVCARYSCTPPHQLDYVDHVGTFGCSCVGYFRAYDRYFDSPEPSCTYFCNYRSSYNFSRCGLLSLGLPYTYSLVERYCPNQSLGLHQ